MNELLHAIEFAIIITVPNLLLMLMGYILKQKAEINTDFINIASKLVFNYCLPCLLFFSVIHSEVEYQQQIPLILAGLVTTFILYFGAEIYAYFFVKNIEDKGVFVQGIFRSNMAIISLAMVTNAYGQQGLSIGAVYMGIITIVFNILAIISLSRTQTQAPSLLLKISNIFKKIIYNPLVIALVSAFIYKALHLPMPMSAIEKTGNLLANITLPLALICAGASVDVKTMLQLSGLSMQASLGRIIIAPLIAVAVGLAFHLSPVHLGVLFLMVSAPVAAASYVMAKAMGGNATLAANILGFTTIFLMLSVAIGSVILRSLGLM